MIYSLTEWEKNITEAYASNFTLREWCRKNQIGFSTFCEAKKRLLSKGKLNFLVEKVPLTKCSQILSYVEITIRNQQTFLILKPIAGNLSMESRDTFPWPQPGDTQEPCLYRREYDKLIKILEMQSHKND